MCSYFYLFFFLFLYSLSLSFYDYISSAAKKFAANRIAKAVTRHRFIGWRRQYPRLWRTAYCYSAGYRSVKKTRGEFKKSGLLDVRTMAKSVSVFTSRAW